MDLNLSISGHSTSDLEQALEQALSKVRQGYLAGFDSNETGSYNFTIEGSPVEEYAIAKGGDDKDIGDDRYLNYHEARETAGPGDTVVGMREDGEILTRDC